MNSSLLAFFFSTPNLLRQGQAALDSARLALAAGAQKGPWGSTAIAAGLLWLALQAFV